MVPGSCWSVSLTGAVWKGPAPFCGGLAGAIGICPGNHKRWPWAVATDHSSDGSRAAIGWHSMELWGASLYGNPCPDCGYNWSLTVSEAIALVSGLPAKFSDFLEGRRGDERHPELGWTSAGYVSHVTDNLRTWAERLAGARLGGAVHVPGYDPDLLAQARCYNEISSAAALWSLRGAVAAWGRPCPWRLTSRWCCITRLAGFNVPRMSPVTTRMTGFTTSGMFSGSSPPPIGTAQRDPAACPWDSSRRLRRASHRFLAWRSSWVAW